LELSAIADENAAAMMSGRISADVQANLARSSAMKALQGGFGASSEMGRGLAARDLGLTSLNLQQQGFKDYEAQRRLNYDTRVSGTDVSSAGLLQNDQRLLSERARSGLDAGIRVAEVDLGQRQGVADKTFGTKLTMADTRRNEEVNLARGLYTSESGRSRDVLGMEIGNLVDFNNRERGLQDLRFNTNTGLSKEIFKTRQGNTGTMTGIYTNAASGFYNTGVMGRTNVYGQNVNALGTATNLKAGAESQRLANNTQARTRATATSMEILDRRYQYDMNEWAKPKGWFENMVQGASIGASEGSAFGPWGTAGGAIFGGIDGAAGGPLYEAKTRNGYDYSSSGSGSNMFAGMGGMSSMGMFGSNMGGSGMTGGQMNSSTIPGTTGSYQSWAGGYVPKATTGA
jgi:hypothetical protein